MRDIIILGSTGSIGTQALDLISSCADEFRVVGLAAGGGNIDVLARQVLDVNPEVVAVSRATAVQDLQLALYAEAQRRGWARGQVRLPKILAGPESVSELAAADCDVVLNGITGAAGLLPTLATLKAGTTLALANKESLVIGGRLVTSAAAPGQIVPVDSEHSALAQCLRAGTAEEVAALVLTASGGPFRGRGRAELADVTPAEALAHPTWDMGRVVTTNSATMVNKGLELLEAHLLFDVPIDRIQVVVHAQSMVHSMVTFVDGSTIAQVSPPDMKLPIALGLTWPARLPGSIPGCDWSTASSWTFEPLDEEAFAGVKLARTAALAGGTAPAVLNAANEECVDAFHEGRVGFLGICDTVERVLAEHIEGVWGEDLGSDLVVEPNLDTVLAADRWARARARAITSEV
ncbi:1-deoxy-D-xylulose-5-phosphate reductoisomerase [Enemella sp. A6]|uniref:1-deoxy-D-xylulose-5-phosphate reductoisomerase n=1 Tax=Enemella sp. A6 TaxID=3440152 RepID=UPI003EBB8428